MKTVFSVTVWILLLTIIIAGIPRLGINESKAANHFYSSNDTPLNVLEPATTDKDVVPEPIALSLKDFVRLVRDRNEQIDYQNSEWAISREALNGAKSIFEPALVGLYQYEEDNRRNTVQELVSQGFIPEFHQKSDNYQAAVEGLVPTGAKLRLGYTLRDFSNSIDERYGVENEAQTVVGATLTQPLLKGGGIGATMAGIRVAEAETDIAFQNYRGQMMRVMSEAIASYWELYLAQEKYKIRKESERNAQEILKDNIVRVKIGKMAETEVLETEAGLALRRSLVSEAKQAIVSAMNSVRTFFSSSVAKSQAEIEPTDQLELKEVSIDYAQSLDKAFKLRSEFLSTLKKIKREEIRLVFAKNQRWPQLDLKGTYNINGLADSSRNSWDDALNQDFETWSVGVELRIPLGGDQKSRSELEATKHRKRQALAEMKAVIVAVANTVDTAVKNVHNTREQVKHYNDAKDRNRRLLEVEAVRFKAGKSNSRILLEREEDLNKAKEAEIESLVRYHKALLQLNLAEGSLLLNYGIEMMEVDL